MKVMKVLFLLIVLSASLFAETYLVIFLNDSFEINEVAIRKTLKEAAQLGDGEAIIYKWDFTNYKTERCYNDNPALRNEAIGLNIHKRIKNRFDGASKRAADKMSLPSRCYDCCSNYKDIITIGEAIKLLEEISDDIETDDIDRKEANRLLTACRTYHQSDGANSLLLKLLNDLQRNVSNKKQSTEINRVIRVMEFMNLGVDSRHPESRYRVIKKSDLDWCIGLLKMIRPSEEKKQVSTSDIWSRDMTLTEELSLIKGRLDMIEFKLKIKK